MGIATIAKNSVDSIVSRYGTNLMIYSFSASANAYGDVTPVYTGSVWTKGILSYVSEEELQRLPEGERTDELMNGLVKSTETIAIKDKINISGTTTNFEVVQIAKEPIIENQVMYKKVWLKRL